MMSTALVSRFQQFWGQYVATAPQPSPLASITPAATAATMTINVISPDPIHPIKRIQIKGSLDRRADEAFVTNATALYRQGCRRLIVDLTATTQLDLAGRFALYNVARLFADVGLLNPEAGWAVLHQAEEPLPVALGDRVKLVATPALARLIRQHTFCQELSIYPTMDSACAAFYPLPA